MCDGLEHEVLCGLQWCTNMFGYLLFVYMYLWYMCLTIVSCHYMFPITFSLPLSPSFTLLFTSHLVSSVVFCFFFSGPQEILVSDMHTHRHTHTLSDYHMLLAHALRHNHEHIAYIIMNILLTMVMYLWSMAANCGNVS